ncbi:electron transfer flavoprotein alpha subunit apoprotein [Ferrimonas sediminum]|uniref:Electron transfer flavoprotein alpha subunit apoprotein n=1 Tax=Ferrimonas sediminum TaxID=718193 RepID=A0A1G8PRE2_9GAMM|nr:FAD-binding protein [Ferrimonas sediminum]SDI94992.1 electron transfer flavoprotein alpha subunit apoprotein [Ferrimonas sediminum]
MSKLPNVWVFSDVDSRLPEVITGGLQLGDKVSALVLGTDADVAMAHSLGAHQVFHLGEKPDTRIVEDYVDTMIHAADAHGRPELILIGATRRGKAIAAKLGARLQAGVFNDASELEIADAKVKAKHMVYGGLALGEETLCSQTAIVTLANGVFEPAAATGATGETVSLDFVAPKHSITCVERRQKAGQGVDLGKAKRVIGIGSGIVSQDNLKKAQELASLLGAEMGCSRPIAETEKWMERERYIGVSGIMLKPELYFAVGISGQIQHMVGVNSAQTIVAINKDKNAPIFQYADYGLVGDAGKVIPALIESLNA